MTGGEIVITGFGVVCPLASNRHDLLDRFRRGERVAASAQLAGRGALVESVPVDAIPADQRARIGRLDRLCRMVLSASYLAMDDAGLSPPGAGSDYDRERSAISFGTGLGCLLTNATYNSRIIEAGPRAASPRLFAYTVSSAAAGEVSIALGMRGPNLTSHHGLAAGLGALGYGADLIDLGRADMVLAGGADALSVEIVEGLDALGVLAPAHGRDAPAGLRAGLFPAEAAVVAVLEDGERARARGARVLARLEGYAAGFEPTLVAHNPQPDGIRATAARALERSRRSAAEVDEVWPAASGTALERVEHDAIFDALGAASPAVSVPSKPALGETFGAAGMLALVLAAGRARPTEADTASIGARNGAGARIAMIHSLCYSGNSVATVVSTGD
jgi:3-oxoacyl-[acyl-carrier-protein] synthase II